MFKVNINWNDVSDKFGFDLPKPGKYRAKIIVAKEKYSDNAGDYIGIELQIQEPEAYMSSKIFDNLMFHNKTCLEKTKKVFKLIGLPLKGDQGLPSTMQISSSKEICIKVIHEEYNGKESAKVDFFNGYFPLEELEKKDIKVPDNVARKAIPEWDPGNPPF